MSATVSASKAVLSSTAPSRLPPRVSGVPVHAEVTFSGHPRYRQTHKNGFTCILSTSNVRIQQRNLLDVRNGLKSSWAGKGHLGNFSLPQLSATADKRRIDPAGATRGVALASLLGVGAPEILVVAVVALLVFGPKGLAEVAKNLGSTLRTFQPTIRELQQVSQEFRSTLEQEIGLDELRNPPPQARPPPQALPEELQGDVKSAQSSAPGTGSTGPAKPAARGYSAEEYAQLTEEQVAALLPEEARRASELAAWGGTPPTSKAAPPGTQPPAPAGDVKSEPVTAPAAEVKKDAP